MGTGPNTYRTISINILFQVAVPFRFHVCAYSIDPPSPIMERILFDKAICNSVRSGVIPLLNRDKESSLKLRADNF